MDGKREQWKSEFGFLLAAVGSAIGLGNIWRFSYMAYENGGGAFLIPYLVALLTAGIPLLLLEFAVGHERIGSAPLAYAKIKKNWEWLGWWAVTFVMFGIELYYVVVISWCLKYFLFSFNLAWGADPNSFFFKEFLILSDGPASIGNIRAPIFLALVIIWIINWFIVYRGIDKGIEIANKIFMPLLLLLTAVLVFWAFRLEGASIGLKAYLTPDFSKLTQPKVWIDAYSQIFFTLSLGFGIMIAYASYLPSKANISKSAFLTAFINSGYSIFAGFATFSVLGYMAKSQGVEISMVVDKSIGLAFVVYPKALNLMPGGAVFGAIFFFCLVVAGLSSSISIIEAFVSAMVDKFGFNRKTLITVICVLGFLGSVIFTTQGGLFWLDIVDHFLTHYGLVVVGIAECILVGWFFNLEVIRGHINKISSIKIGAWWGLLIRFFVPIILLIILVGDLYNEVQKPYEGYTWTTLILIGRDWVLATLLVAFIIATRPWRTKKQDEEGRSS
jgi:NSS family neurotransmitter:Na+ symporter